jgi:hypothetical protein
MQWKVAKLVGAAVIGLLLMLAERAGAGDGPALRVQAAGCSGTIVDLSCDTVIPSGGTARCDAGEHYFALKVPGDDALRPLVVDRAAPGADALRAGALTGREVRISGVCSPEGAIVVNDVAPLG